MAQRSPRSSSYESTGSMVVAEGTRVTILTERMVRIEYATDGVFEDRPTLAASERPPAANESPATTPGTEIEFGVHQHPTGQGFVIDTGAMQLTVLRPDSPPTRQSLFATFRDAEDPRWFYGKVDRENLGGTRRTLDGWKGNKRQKVTITDEGRIEFGRWRTQQLDPGLLSRDGWAVFDDSGSPVFEPGLTDRGPWPVGRSPHHRVDIYLMAHDRDYLGALRDAAATFGRSPLLPRAVLGYWYSRYYAYTDRELEGLVDRFDQLGLPLDVVVIDMDWHLPRWTGYSWDTRYFPDPARTLRRLHDRDLQVTLNLHPADGVGRHEAAFADMCADLGLDPERTKRIPFDSTDPYFVDSYFRRLHHPNEDIGVDFWWMDWQQEKTTAVPGLDPLPWLNKLHWDDQLTRRPHRRPMSFSRWGGLGSGRYPVGFSGDTYTTWESLAYQPEFTATAANVLYGYWSHDIGGHYGPQTTGELMTRWMQLGVYSPILRTHGSKDTAQERRIWQFESPYREQMIADLHRRYELIPYIYGACRTGIDDGRALVRPMYHECPDLDAAYEHPGQFWFGPDLIVSPVTLPVEVDESAEVATWLPPGDWYELSRGEHHRVSDPLGQVVSRRYRLEEVPVFARAGAVLPGQRDARRTSSPCYELPVFSIVPSLDTMGSGGASTLYEDDGVTEAWRSGDAVSTPMSWSRNGDISEVIIGPALGHYEGWIALRPVELRLLGTAPPAEVWIGRRQLSWADTAGDDVWWWDASTASTCLRLSSVDLRARTKVKVVADPSRSTDALNGLPALGRRLDRVTALCALASPHTPLHPEERLPVALSQATHRIALDPTRYAAELYQLHADLRRLPGVLGAFAQAWRDAMAFEWADQRSIAANLVDQAARILDDVRS